MYLSAAWNADYLDAQYKLWKKEPDKFSREWRLFFEGFELADSGQISAESVPDDDQRQLQSRVQALIADPTCANAPRPTFNDEDGGRPPGYDRRRDAATGPVFIPLIQRVWTQLPSPRSV